MTWVDRVLITAVFTVLVGAMSMCVLTALFVSPAIIGWITASVFGDLILIFGVMFFHLIADISRRNGKKRTRAL